MNVRLGLAAALAVALLWAGYAFGQASAAPGVVTRTDTVEVTNPELERRIEELELDTGRLRDRLARRAPVEPRTVYVAADVQPPPDACQLTVRVDNGMLSATPLTRQPSDSTGRIRYRGALLEGLDVSRCDDGFSVSPQGIVVCDAPTLGHLGLNALAGWSSAGAWGGLGLSWTPYWRSAWRGFLNAEAIGDGVLYRVGLERRLTGFW